MAGSVPERSVGNRPLTERQRCCLKLIISSILERGFPPTLREIGREMGIGSTNGVSDHLYALQRKGYIEVARAQARAIKVLDSAYEAVL